MGELGGVGGKGGGEVVEEEVVEEDKSAHFVSAEPFFVLAPHMLF